MDFMIKPISSDILVVELLNLGAGADSDTILWNSNLAQPVFAMTLAQLKWLKTLPHPFFNVGTLSRITVEEIFNQ